MNFMRRILTGLCKSGLALVMLNFLMLVSFNAVSVPMVSANEKPMITATAIVYSVEGTFDDIKDELVRAVEDKGAVITYLAHSSEMLNRTAVTLNISTRVYEKAEILLFCKAEISHRMVQSDPHSLVQCPYPIAIYTLNKQPNTVYLSIRKSPEGLPAYAEIQKLLIEIVEETVDF